MVAAAALASGAAYGQQASEGATLYAAHCALCHGAEGRGGQGFPRPIWGAGHDLKKFGDAEALFDYLQLTMPFDNPQKLSDAQKVAVLAFLLERIGALGAGTPLAAGNLSNVKIK